MLSIERKLLEEEGDAFRVNGKTYSRSQIEEDALNRVSACKQLSTQKKLAQQNFGVLRKGISTAQQSLMTARRVRHEKGLELEELKILLADKGVRVWVQGLVGELQSGASSSENRLARISANAPTKACLVPHKGWRVSRRISSNCRKNLPPKPKT